MHPEGSATSWDFLRIRLQRLSAVPALLVCYAIVFNVAPFAKSPQPEAAREVPQQSNGATLIAHLQSSAAAAGRAESLVSADDNDVRTASRPLDLTPASISSVPMPGADTRPPNGPAQQATIEGIWAPNASSCSLRDLRDGSLATIIGMEGARAGDTYCAFKQQKQTPTGWRVVASCSNSLEHWTADVRLTVKDDHLTWISRRGRQIYTRCAPDVVRTAAR
jgi:hypothetical protein